MDSGKINLVPGGLKIVPGQKSWWEKLLFLEIYTTS